MAAAKAAFVLTLCAFVTNEAHAAATTFRSGMFATTRVAADLHRLRHHFERSEHEHARSMTSIMENMTSHSALEILRRNKQASPELLALAQTAVSHTHLRAPIVAPKGKSAADGAKFMLNRLLEENMKKYDIEILKCRDYYSKQCGMIEESRGSISASNFKVASCRTHILSAESAISIGETAIPPTKQALTEHRAKCKADVKTLHKKLKALEGDIEVISGILKMTDCAKSFLQTSHHVGRGVGVLRCEHECDNGRKASLLSFDHSPLRQHIDSLKSKVAEELLQQSFSDLAGDTSRNASKIDSNKLRRSLVPASPCEDPSKGAPTPKDKRAAKCTVSGTASCTKLQERFILIQAGLKDSQDSTKDETVDREKTCEETEVTLSKSVEKAEQTLKQQQTKLAEGTSCENEAAESGRLANTEFTELTKEMEQQKSECSTNYQQFETEACGLKKIRSELYTKMKGMGGTPFFQDCKVSDWVAAECSVECGGGVQQMSRSVDTQPQGGAQCLPLTQMRACNQQPCPVDCKLSTWSGWSSCSAECGGGVQERLRDIERNMKHNGNPCGEVSETKSCNVQSCEQDCELSDWTKWAKCSKACDGGTRKRIKRVKVAAIGQGECPMPTSKDRIAFKRCNAHACVKPKDKETISCDAKLDLILVLDGSGSLGKKGWAATKKAASLIIGSLDKKKAKVGVLLFSGPNDWATVRKCYTDGKVNKKLICKMNWVQHLTSNIGKVLSKVEFLGWPKGSTLTSMALMDALAETQLGRQDAQTVVAVITDGKPVSKSKTWRAAKAVRKVARLMWIPVTKFAPLRFIRRMATKRWQENVVLARSFSTLAKPEFVNHIIADMCPQVGTTTTAR